jgi:outer membrane immunogenic protein
MNKLLTAGAALLALGLSVPAKAADMPVKYVAPAPVFTWTGCYVGVHIGYKWARSTHTSTGLINGAPVGITPGADIAPTINSNGPVGGGEAGCNYQVGAWVWGVEVDGGWAAASGQQNNFGPPISNPNFVSATNERWLTTARARLGWAADRWLWYVTAGGAWTGVDITSANLGAAVPATVFGESRITKGGWIVGVGSEYALLGGWSVKSEWLYANFGTLHALDFSCTTAVGCGVPGNGVTARDVKLNEFIWRVGMNYRFDWATFGKGKGKAPAVVAKY